MAFNTKIKLFNKTMPNGTAKPQKIEEKTVWASVDSVSMATSYTAMSAGVKLTYQCDVRAKAYTNEQYAEVNGKDYKIENAVKTGNKLVTRLLLSRG